MEITKTQKDLIEKVTEQYKPYIQALRTPDLKSQTPIDNYKVIYNAIIIACEYTWRGKNRGKRSNPISCREPFKGAFE